MRKANTNRRVTSSNIVISYAEIRFNLINMELLRGIVELEDDKFGASLFDQPNFKRLILPQSKKTILIAPDRKMVVEDVSGKEPTESNLISRYLPNVQEAIKDAASKPVAYGFNYFVIVDDAAKPVSNPNLERLFKNHKILGLGSRIIYSLNGGDKLLDLRFEPNVHNKKQYIVQLNAHYEIATMGLPNTNILNKQYRDNWTHLDTTIKRLFSGGVKRGND